MLVERELAIRAFVPEEYLEVVATFAPDKRGCGRRPLPRDVVPRRAADSRGPAAAEGRRRGRAIVERVRAGRAAVESVESETRRLPPPLLYDLTELQRHANRLYGWRAKQTLEVAQALYEEKKLLTYPRTDSRHLSRDVAADAARGGGRDRRAVRGAPRPGHRRAAARAGASSTTRR